MRVQESELGEGIDLRRLSYTSENQPDPVDSMEDRTPTPYDIIKCPSNRTSNDETTTPLENQKKKEHDVWVIREYPSVEEDQSKGTRENCE